MISCHIRKAQEADIPVFLKYDLIMLGETLGEELIKEHLYSDFMEYFIMETESTNDFVGMISIWVDEDKAQINNFYIIDRYQNQKLGKMFIEYIIENFKKNKIKEVTLEVRRSNLKAISFYEKYDFKQASVRKNYYKNGEDALLMYLRIGSD